MDTGGKVIILLGEGGEQEFNTNINFFLEEYGMTINNGKCKVILAIRRLLSLKLACAQIPIYTFSLRGL